MMTVDVRICEDRAVVSFARMLRLHLVVCQFPETLSPPVVVCVVMETCPLELVLAHSLPQNSLDALRSAVFMKRDNRDGHDFNQTASIYIVLQV